MINGSPKGYFKSSLGLGRGDPLSPMLFVVVVEAFSVLMERDKLCRLITGFSTSNSFHEVTHLQFANDTNIFLWCILEAGCCFEKYFEMVPRCYQVFLQVILSMW